VVLVALALAACGGAGGPATALPGSTGGSAASPGGTIGPVPGSPGGAGGPAPASPVTDRAVDFLVVSTTPQSGHQEEAARIAVQVEGDRLRITAYQGLQRTGGFSIRVAKIERSGTTLRVHASFNQPAKDAIVTMALTSPAHVVSIAQADAVGLQEAVLVDQNGTERARARLA